VFTTVLLWILWTRRGPQDRFQYTRERSNLDLLFVFILRVWHIQEFCYSHVIFLSLALSRPCFSHAARDRSVIADFLNR